jgi:hypothetical protein
MVALLHGESTELETISQLPKKNISFQHIIAWITPRLSVEDIRR